MPHRDNSPLSFNAAKSAWHESFHDKCSSVSPLMYLGIVYGRGLLASLHLYSGKPCAPPFAPTHCGQHGAILYPCLQKGQPQAPRGKKHHLSLFPSLSDFLCVVMLIFLNPTSAQLCWAGFITCLFALSVCLILKYISKSILQINFTHVPVTQGAAVV